MRLNREFFEREVLEVAPDLLGKMLVIRRSDGKIEKRTITDVEAYGGEEDLASHARFGKTERNNVMYGKAGVIYVYFIYGMYWLMNIITSQEGNPQAVLIRGLEGISGPGRVGKWLGLDKSFYGEDLTRSKRVWVEDNEAMVVNNIVTKERVGVDYAANWARKKWRFIIDQF